MHFMRIFGIVALSAALGACTAEVEDPGSLPDIDVEGGEMPRVDVDPVDVDISTDTQVVVVPDIDINRTDER